jgi:hypothetical protein
MLGAVGLVVVLLAGAIALLVILGRTSSFSWSSSSSSSTSSGGCAKKQKNPPPQQQQQQGGSSSSSPSWISLKVPAAEDLNLQVLYGALAMNTDGSLLAIGDPYYYHDDDELYRGRVVLLQQQQDGARPFYYRTVQVLEAPEDYTAFGTAVALSSSSTNSTLVVGSAFSTTGPTTVQVYVQRASAATAANDSHWEIVGEFPNQSNDDLSGYWVAVSDDGSRIVYSAPKYQPEAAGDIGYAAPRTNGEEGGPLDDQYDNPTGAVLLWHNGEQEAFFRGECADEAFGLTVSISSSSGDDAAGAPPVVVITRAGCWYANEELQRTITVWEGNGDSVTNLLVRDPNEDCSIGRANRGTAAKVSKDGRRIVVLAACVDKELYPVRQAIYTFEKDPHSQAWVELVPDNNDDNNNSTVVVIESHLQQYRMSRFAFDDDAKTVVLTAAGRGPVNEHGTDLVCYKWNETTVSWQESWRKVASDDDDDFVGTATSVALSGNGKRLAIIGSRTTSFSFPRLAVYDLP